MQMTPAIRGVSAALLCLLLCSIATAQQTSRPLDGQPWDFGMWGSAGFSVPGGTSDILTMNVGVRAGKILTDDHGGGFVRGNFEWSADLIPAYLVLSKATGTKNAIGVGFNPVNLKWNFTRSEKFVPFTELGGGVLFSNTEVPTGTSRVNFLTHATFGVHAFAWQKRALTLSVRYEHISNAGLSTPNPGINTVQFLIGMNWFK